MSRTREEKLNEDLDPETREDIEAQYDLIERIESLESNDIVVVETQLDIHFAGEVVDYGPDGSTENYVVYVEVLAYDGPDHAEDDLAFLNVDRIGAQGSLHEWKGVPYTTAFPDEGHQDTWGDLKMLDVLDDADEAIRVIENE